MKDNAALFGTGFIQVLLVCVNTWQIAHAKWLGVFVVGFLISYVWTWNVKKVAFGGQKDRFIYALGAAVGAVAGLMIAVRFYD
ncbi:MAG: hypothetical protein KF855_03270 [Acidobacteria bacterium]|nr:hypothetical protein [Acidobacteriota bacterium]